MSEREFPDEGILPDDYLIYGDYLYVVDGELYRSDWHGITVLELRHHLMAKEIRRCNIGARMAALRSATRTDEVSA